jgi:prepilin-type processing-associated H-X9-DG protein
MDENLIGYLFDALDEPERREVEAHLSRYPQAQARLDTLRRALAPLEADAEQPEPPRHLTLDTLARIAEQECRTIPIAPPPQRRTTTPWRGLRKSDLLAAAGLLILVGGLSIPWLLHQQYAARRLACGNNMAQYGAAMTQFCNHHEGQFPSVPETGPRSFAGIFVPMLRDDGLLKETPHLLCCDSAKNRALTPATVKEMEDLWQQPDQSEFQRRARHLAGNYAYNLGYRDEGGILKGPHRVDDPYHPILADHCPNPTETANSPNHGGHGQNVLYTDGHVKWCTTPTVGLRGDNIYLNRENKVQAGIGPDDTVLGPGEATPGKPE